MTKTSKKKSKKHPMKMTTDEALNHLFHPEIAKALREHAEKPQTPKKKRA
jgi:hypothetical protein